MINALKKKNAEYSIKERRVTSLITLVLFSIIGYWMVKNIGVLNSSAVYPYLGGALIGLAMGFVGFKYPKLIHLSIFALPLIFIGS